MSIDPATVCLWVPPELKKFKLKLFNAIASHIEGLGGRVIRHDYKAVQALPDEIIPIIGCSPQFRDAIIDWRTRGRNFIVWDRGYLRRVFATWLPTGSALGVPGGYYRWTVNAFQMKHIRDVPDDRWKALKLEASVKPWHKGRHIVIADTGVEYWDIHAHRSWSHDAAAELRKHTDRPIRMRGKEAKTPLYDDLADAHALVTHGSIAAVEAVVMGCPVFVDKSSAAAPVGMTDFSQIERPVYPERQRWLNALAYCQFSEPELINGTLWKLIA